MIARLPIRLRVAAAFAVAMTVVLAASGIFLYARLESHLALALDRQLQQRAEDLAALLASPATPITSEGTGRFVERGESYAELLGPSGVLEATRELRRTRLLSAREVALASRRTIYRDRPSTPGLDEPSRLLATPILRGRRRLVLVVGVTRQNDLETLNSFRRELLVAGPAALLLATLVGYVLAGAALRPVERMRQRASEISADLAGTRLPVPATGDEVERLGRTLNDMLGRLEAGIRRERDFVTDAGHELRTPLGILRTELEVALRHGRTAEELRTAIRSSSLEAARLSQLAEDLLVVARGADGGIPLRLEPISADELLRRIRARFEWRAADDGATIELPGGAACVFEGDALRLEQALGNLVDNALRNGARRVELTAERTGGAVELRVADDGPGFAESFLPRAFDRFAREDPARSGPGSGLGLAIVRAIAEAHGGTVEAGNRQPRGAVVSLLLPEASS